MDLTENSHYRLVYGHNGTTPAEVAAAGAPVHLGVLLYAALTILLRKESNK